jgi:hypothetical protein
LRDLWREHTAGVVIELHQPGHDVGATLWAELLKNLLCLSDLQRIVLGIRYCGGLAMPRGTGVRWARLQATPPGEPDRPSMRLLLGQTTKLLEGGV